MSESDAISAPGLSSSSGARPARVLVLFGAPGSGKGTQAKLLAGLLGVPHVSTGDMLRERVAAGAESGSEVRALMSAGALVSDAMVSRMVEERLKAADCRAGAILDGYPRTLAQAQDLERLLGRLGCLHLAIHLKVDYTKIIARIAGRRQCVRCGTLYNLAANPPKAPGICDHDGEPLTIREDDRESVVRERLEGYERLTRPAIEFFAQPGKPFCEVDGSDAGPEQVFARIRACLVAE